jgi:hypothetical protein
LGRTERLDSEVGQRSLRSQNGTSKIQGLKNTRFLIRYRTWKKLGGDFTTNEDIGEEGDEPTSQEDHDEIDAADRPKDRRETSSEH